jgi:hypothetical protein
VQTRAYTRDARFRESPLEVAGERVIPSATRVFTSQQTLFVLFQAYAPEGVDVNRLRAGLTFFRNGRQVNQTPMVAPAEVNAENRTASFRMSLPLAEIIAGRYSVQAIAVEAGGTHAAFGRNFLALRPPVSVSAP